MRNIILNLAMSLDGFVEGPNGEFDWCYTDQDYGMTEFLNRIDAIFFGRKSYEVLLNYDQNPYPDKKKYVFSTTLPSDERITLIRDHAVEEIRRIKELPGKDIWLFGGPSLMSSLMREGLVDEFMLSVHPLILSAGKPLFTDLTQRVPLVCMDTKTYSTGLVQLFYRLDPKK